MFSLDFRREINEKGLKLTKELKTAEKSVSTSFRVHTSGRNTQHPPRYSKMLADSSISQDQISSRISPSLLPEGKINSLVTKFYLLYNQLDLSDLNTSVDSSKTK